MNSTIQKRIEAIQSGKTPKGYKKTKWGTIPDNWEIKSLGEIAKKNTIKNLDLTYTEVFTNSAQHGIVPQNQHFDKDIANADNIDGYYIVEPKDFVYNPRISVTAPCGPINMNSLGKTGVVSPLYTVFSIHSCDVETIFIKYYFQSSIWYDYMKSIANYGVRHDRMNIANDDFFAMPLTLPPLPEQTAIAEILTQQDRLIDLLQKRIDEKRQQKKFLMQTLLTGKIRLPGFKGKWKYTKAKEVFIPVSNKNNNGDLEVLSVTQDKGVIPRSQVDIDIKYNEASVVGYKLVQKGNFVISLRSFQGGIEYSDFNGVVSPAYTVLENAIDICHTFYKYYFKTPDYINRLSIAVYGIRDGKQISYNDFSTITIPLPPLPEQEAIAEILSTADEELSLLERELEQEKLRKKALMQLLLTGLVRIEEL